jgi:uncharacterized protein YdgA (DUF945 family)
VKRWIVMLLVVAALVVLVSPGIVGRLAERNLEQNIEWAEADAPEVRVQTESFDRGWFTSEGRHRISLSGTPLMSGSDESASIIIETRVDHGIVSITSLSRAGGSLEPGIAQAVSTFSLDTGTGEVIDLPGTAYSRIGLSGVTDVRYLLEKGTQETNGGKAAWDGADVSVSVDQGQRTVSVDGTVEAITFNTATESGSIGGVEIRGMEEQTDYGFSIGNIDLTTGPIRFTDVDGTTGGFEEFRLKGETRIERERVNADYTMNVGRLNAPMLGHLGMDLAVTVDGFDAQAVGDLAAAIREAESAVDPALAVADFYPMIEKDLHALLAAGGTVDVRQFDISLPQGEITSKLKVSVDKADPDAAFSWPALALLLTASADVRLPEMLVDMMLMMNPQGETIRQMGLLRKDGDAYEMQAEFAQGLLTVNGAPFPIPVQGF